MFRVPSYYRNISLRLSQTLDDIGVTERIVKKRRRAKLIEENIALIISRLTDDQHSYYYLGSQCEGTATTGLMSDMDTLVCLEDHNVIQDWSEWIPGSHNLMMIQDAASSPGYCFLQCLKPWVPLPDTAEHEHIAVADTHGRILYKNTFLDTVLPEGECRQGPSIPRQGGTDSLDTDTVLAFPCRSCPQAFRKWLDHQELGWPTVEMKKHAEHCRCFVVAVGSKVGENVEFEWRISAGIAERHLMLNLNITQVRCYVLMKMIIKTYINSRYEGSISSYMCKTVLLHCIKCKYSNIWRESNILNCLSYCLRTLFECLSSENCPQFIVNENNLMAGRYSVETKGNLLRLMSNVIQDCGRILLGIQIDGTGQRMQNKLNIIHQVQNDLDDSVKTKRLIAGALIRDTALSIFNWHTSALDIVAQVGFEGGLQFLLENVCKAASYTKEDMEKAACRLLVPLHCALLGSLLASYNIQHFKTVSPQALACILAGFNSDVASSKLKYASVFYCTGDMERAALVLRDIENQYNTAVVEPMCGCYKHFIPAFSESFCTACYDGDEESIREIVAFCVRYLPYEIQCVPLELQYEMFRSTQEELLEREESENWMDWAVVDALPFMYFLQYKTYGSLQRT
ncbi:uncharacterized protein LOC123545080 [Mercenaria mercenaria]|uniref:uncharacterized protein LOC123545080 n=1 Tax=Mercenaria mercenaria TaxID=6596 RepID=UPI00234F2ADB|nr:uncharacterized protein LOC123545080 [Mercenaria mercenaria]